MIPAPLFSIPQLILLLLPFVAILLSVGLLLHALWWWHAARPAAFWTRTTLVLAVIAAAGNAWGLVLLYQTHKMQAKFALQSHYRESRSHFVLPEDFQYGELLIPKGSLVDRYDPYDNGEPQRPLGLRGLNAIRFAHPVQVAGAWVTAIDGHTLELDRDQRIRPVFHFDRDANDNYGAWVVNPQRPYLECKQGDMARVHIPLIDWDVVAELTTGEPDGAQARYRPSQWGFVECKSGLPPIDVKPAYALPGPDGAQPGVWGPLQPAKAD